MKRIILTLSLVYLLILTACAGNNNIILNLNCVRYQQTTLLYKITTNLENGALIRLQITGQDYHVNEILSIKDGKIEGKFYNLPEGHIEILAIFHPEIPNQPQWVIDKYGKLGEKIQGREKDEYTYKGYKAKTGNSTRIEAIYIVN